jgi:hypothetical protein
MNNTTRFVYALDVWANVSHDDSDWMLIARGDMMRCLAKAKLCPLGSSTRIRVINYKGGL